LVPWHVRVQARENDARMPLYKGRTAMKFKNEGTKFRKDGLKSRKDGKKFKEGQKDVQEGRN
jgi:hypothetical protein